MLSLFYGPQNDSNAVNITIIKFYLNTLKIINIFELLKNHFILVTFKNLPNSPILIKKIIRQIKDED